MGLFKNAFFISSTDIEFSSKGRGRHSRSAQFVTRNGNSATILQNAPDAFMAGAKVVDIIERSTNVDLKADSAKTELLDAAAVVIHLPASGMGIVEPLAAYLPSERIYILPTSIGDLGPLVDEWLEHGRIDCKKYGVLRFMNPPTADLPPFPPVPKARA